MYSTIYSTVYSTVYSYFSGTFYEVRMLQKCRYQSITSLVPYMGQKRSQTKEEASKKQKSKHRGPQVSSEVLSYTVHYSTCLVTMFIKTLSLAQNEMIREKFVQNRLQALANMVHAFKSSPIPGA
jgi:hypothetical protein